MVKQAREKGREIAPLKKMKISFLHKPGCSLLHRGGLFCFVGGACFIEAGYQSTESRHVWLYISPVHLLKMGKACTSYLVFISTHICAHRHRPDLRADALCWHTEGQQKNIFLGPLSVFHCQLSRRVWNRHTIYWVVFGNLSVVTTIALISINTH